MAEEQRSSPISFRYKTLLIGAALAGLTGLSVLVILWPRTTCEGIFEQTAPKLEAHLEIIRNKGAFAVRHEKIQEISESSQKVGLHLKACCSVLEGGKLNPEQFQQCIDKAATYDRQIALVAQQVTEAAEAGEKGATTVLQEKITSINQVIQTATSDAENFARQVAQIKPPGRRPEPGKGDKERGSETEPNNTAAQATELRLSGEIVAEVSTGEDIDYYKLVTTKQLRDWITVKLENRSQSLAPQLTLYNQDKSRIREVYDVTLGADIKLSFAAETGTYYFIKVSPWSGTGKYKLTADYQNAHDSFEPNDNADTATTINPGQSLDANIMDGEDRDWYRLARAPGARVRVQLQNRSTSLAPEIKVYDEKRSKILNRYDTTPGASLDFTFDTMPDKGYYLEVLRLDNFGLYQLTVN